jgi:hypothetical protein
MHAAPVAEELRFCGVSILRRDRHIVHPRRAQPISAEPGQIEHAPVTCARREEARMARVLTQELRLKLRSNFVRGLMDTRSDGGGDARCSIHFH